jgi:hypothetical protein
MARNVNEEIIMYKDNSNKLINIQANVIVAKSKWQTKDGKWWINDGSGKKPYNPNEPTKISSDSKPEGTKKLSPKERELHEELDQNIEAIKNGEMTKEDVLNTIDDLADGVGLSRKKVAEIVKQRMAILDNS